MFHRSLQLTGRQVLDGGELAYLAATPVWFLTIAWGQSSNRSAVDVHDRQTDWIVAVPVALITAIALDKAQARLGDLAILWRLDLLALVVWAWACSVLIFGLRRVLATSRAWTFALLCWPALYETARGTLGSGGGVPLGLDLALALIAVALAADSRSQRWRAIAVAAITGAPVLFLIRHLSGGAAVTVVALLPLWALVIVAPELVSPPGPSGLSPAGAGRRGPVTTAIELALLAAIGVLVSLAIHAPATSASAPLAPPVQGTPHPGPTWRLVSDERFSWAPEYFGPGATLTRYVFDHRDHRGARAVVDVLAGARESDLSGDRLTPVYQDDAANLIGRVRLTARISGELAGSQPIGDLVPAGTSWVGLDWVTREATRPGRAEQITVFVTQYAGAQLPRVSQPGFTTLISGPIDQLIRGNAGGSDQPSPQARQAAISAAQSILFTGR